MFMPKACFRKRFSKPSSPFSQVNVIAQAPSKSVFIHGISQKIGAADDLPDVSVAVVV